MLPILLILIGCLIILGSLVLYSFLVEFGRGMNSTGCGNNCAIRWSDFTNSDAWIFYIPAVFGLIILIVGIYIFFRRKNTHH